VTPGSNPGTSAYHEGSQSINTIAAIVLAGGRGVRMQSDLPKVLQPFLNRPLILHVLESLEKAGVSDICVIVGYRGELVVEAVGNRARPVWQHEQLGTGHAVMQAEETLAGFSGKVIVACGDVPLIRPETFRAMLAAAGTEDVRAVVLTMELDTPTGYGRILKDTDGSFRKIVEEKDASADQRTIREVNTGTYVFDKHLLFEGLRRINTDNAQGEYYLPDALEHVIRSGFTVRTMLLKESLEGSGVNTRDELRRLEDYCLNNGKG
jgi:bifunctional UDP-N-acetylglucosamine pyrophosphorylase / glucosamine-1-phosphate N-acetyltransferase